MNEMEKTSKLKHIFTVVWVVLCIVSVCFIIALKSLAANDIYFYLFGTVYSGIAQAQLILTLVCLLSAAIALIRSDKMWKRITIFMITLVLWIALLYGFTSIFGFFDTDKTFLYEDTSPDGKYSIVVEKWGWLAHGGHNFYLKSNPFFVKELQNSFVHDEVDGAFRFDWQEDFVYITNGSEQVKIPLA